jgi:phosphoribosylformylglycinamidine (FGAM) synthase-like enzyme
VASVHDLSEGGLAIALAESALATRTGFRVDLSSQDAYRTLFAESPSRVIVTCAEESVEAVLANAAKSSLEAHVIGTTGGDELDLGVFSVPLSQAQEVWENGLPLMLSATID